MKASTTFINTETNKEDKTTTVYCEECINPINNNKCEECNYHFEELEDVYCDKVKEQNKEKYEHICTDCYEKVYGKSDDYYYDLAKDLEFMQSRGE